MGTNHLIHYVHCSLKNLACSCVADSGENIAFHVSRPGLNYKPQKEFIYLGDAKSSKH